MTDEPTSPQKSIHVMTLRLPTTLHERLRKQAERDHRTLAAEMQVAVEEFLIAHEPADKKQKNA